MLCRLSRQAQGDRSRGAPCNNISDVTVTLTTSESAPGTAEADVLVIGVVSTPDGPAAAPGTDGVDDALGGTLVSSLAALGATGDLEELTKIPGGGKLPAALVLAVGLGKPAADGSFAAEDLRRAAGTALRDLVGKTKSGGDGENTSRTAALALPARDAAEAEAVATGALLGGYTFRKYRATPAADVAVTLLTGADGEAGVSRGTVIAEAVNLARDLINTSPLHLPPAELAAEAERAAASVAGVTVEVLAEEELAEGGFGGLLGVGQGSTRGPRLVRLAYSHPQASKTIAFVGKGITFDSGGLSLKPPKSMETMKSDMSGAAAALAATTAIASLGLPVNVVGYLCAAENMPGGAAQRPSDIITIYGGKTVEVLNTDAEGRLVLADGIVRAGEDNQDLVVDIATLTGAQVVALGSRTTGVMATSEELAGEVASVLRATGEGAWPMPLPGHLRKGLDSPVADLQNIGNGSDGGGMLVAGHFLKEFVPDGTAWAHLDIAGPAFNSGGPYGYTPKGGTGAAVRALIALAEETAAGRLPGNAAGGE
jgi:leucyl aminopeptidase